MTKRERMQVSIYYRKAYIEVVATIFTRKELEKLIAVLEVYKEILRLHSEPVAKHER